MDSSIPREVLPLSTMFRPENVETDFDTAHELSDFSGLSPYDIVVFRPERLIVHGLLIRVTITLSVPDGPDYEELGINLRNMVRCIFDDYIAPDLPRLKGIYEAVRKDATQVIDSNLHFLRWGATPLASQSEFGIASESKRGFVDRLTGWWKAGEKTENLSTLEDRLEEFERRSGEELTEFEVACKSALSTVINSIIGRRGGLVGDDATLVGLATGLVLNDWASLRLGEAVAPLFEEGARREKYRFLPSQDKPLIMNVKGASAAGKSTIRPKQRLLAERLGIPWQDFALVSPDYWRKYLLDYDSLEHHRKYGAMLTGHELAIIDKKLDRQMAQRAEAGQIPHLLIDRFRFDSFSVGDDQSSQLLTRFGDTVFMYYMITPPEATVDRAYQRGLTTGRYKAVDDLLDHNIEAYTGMPALFFSWASSSKKVHHEFLDNSVTQGEVPRTVAFGWNDSVTILDVAKLLDIERYKKIDVDALAPQDIYLEEAAQVEANLDFLVQCSKAMRVMRFADQTTGRLYGVVEAGEWVMRDVAGLKACAPTDDTLTGLAALGWTTSKVGPGEGAVQFLTPDGDECKTLGSWGVTG